MTDRRTLVRLAALAGGSAGLYSAALAAVVSLQSQTDAATIARRLPSEQAIGTVAATNDRLEANLVRAGERYAEVAATYDELATDLGAVDAAMQALAEAVADVNGMAAKLPSDVALPRISRPTTTIRVTKTVVHATTGASGG